MDAETMLWYTEPAADFDHALPIGNGRIGAMVFGGAADEVLKLNEDSVWSGGKRNRNNPDAREGLEEVRALLREENIAEAEKIAFQKLQGVTPNSRHYMPLGNLNLHMDFPGKPKQYVRSLDLERALSTVRFDAGDVTYIRETFVSVPDHVLVMHIESSERGKIFLNASLDGRDDYYDDCRPSPDDKNTLLYTGGTGSRDGIFFAAALTCFAEGGTVRTLGGALTVSGANAATLILSVGTSFYHGDHYEASALLDASYAAECSYEELLYRHLTEYQEKKKSSKVTIDNIRRILSSFFSWLEDEDYILKSPVRRIHKVKTGTNIKETYSDEALELMRDNCTELRDLAIIDMLASTGMRVGEMVLLNRNDIDFNERECIVFGKGSKERVVYFDARTKIHLQNYLESRTDNNPALFVTLKSPHNRLKIGGVEVRLREFGKQLGINKVHPHKFRRTLATMAIDKGMPIEQLQQLLGHRKIDTTLQYAMVKQSNVKIAHRKYIG